jgi:hypothetical protein
MAVSNAAVIALLDYGRLPIEFGARVPLGVNMAFVRTAFERAGVFDPHTGRRAGTLLGQEVREWCIRARKAGVRGFYLPELWLEHIIPADRLRKAYFRRWFYWRGISRALLYERSGLDMEAPEQTTLDFSTVPHIAGVPRYLYRKALSHVLGWAGRRYTATSLTRSTMRPGSGSCRHREAATEGFAPRTLPHRPRPSDARLSRLTRLTICSELDSSGGSAVSQSGA